MSITEIGASQAESTGGYEQFDTTGLPFVKSHPTTAIQGDLVAVRYFPGEDPSRGYIGVVVDDPGIYVEESGALSRHGDDGPGQVIVKSTKQKGDDYKVVNTTDEQTELIENTGVDFDGNIFYGDVVEAFETDRAVFKFGGGTARSIASVLDRNAAGSADIERTGIEYVDAALVHSDDVYQTDIQTFVADHDDLDSDTDMDAVQEAMDSADELPVEQFELDEDGWPINNRKLIERDDRRGTDEMPRYQRDTTLRPDLEGETVAFLVQRLSDVRDDYDGGAYWSTALDVNGALLGNTSDGEPSEGVAWDAMLEENGVESTAELEAPLSISPTDAFEVPDTLMAADYNGYLEWHYPEEETLDVVRQDNGFETIEEAMSSDTGTVSAD